MIVPGVSQNLPFVVTEKSFILYIILVISLRIHFNIHDFFFSLPVVCFLMQAQTLFSGKNNVTQPFTLTHRTRICKQSLQMNFA